VAKTWSQFSMDVSSNFLIVQQQTTKNSIGQQY